MPKIKLKNNLTVCLNDYSGLKELYLYEYSARWWNRLCSIANTFERERICQIYLNLKSRKLSFGQPNRCAPVVRIDFLTLKPKCMMLF